MSLVNVTFGEKRQVLDAENGVNLLCPYSDEGFGEMVKSEQGG